MADDDLPPRPRRERPLRAHREMVVERVVEPPTVTTPPVGPPVMEFAATDEPSERDDHVVVSFEGPTRQRRWTVALRLFLVIPHLFWAYLVTIAAGAVGFIAWCAALFTGRVPEGLATFLADAVQYQTRVFGYGLFLLTDQYPPFALREDYAINLETNPGKFNRAAVFFRLVLMVPGEIMTFLTLAGAQLASVFGWILTLILGRMPTPLWEANAAVLRYTARFQAFSYLLTAEQPKGMFGDRPATAPAIAEPDLPEQPRIRRLVLSKAARRLVALFIVLTVVCYGGIVTVAAIYGTKASAAYDKLDEGDTRLSDALYDFDVATQLCNFDGGIQCLHAADLELADAFARFAHEIETIKFPSEDDVSSLLGHVRDCAHDLHQMAEAADASSYRGAHERYRAHLDDYYDDYDNLYS